MIVICVKINTDFKHHLKLQIGNKYIAEFIINGYKISDLNNVYIGSYHVDQFMKLRDYNLNKLLDEN